MKSGSKSKKKILCIHCKHYHVTWDPKFPHGCKALGFKTARPPSFTVKESSGMDCFLYEEIKKKRN
ncbi:MAG: uracil-DNA glycosylase [Candidatus Omnitrophota bacterium]|nr:MAG: uracil-DNA glycosylase [Candidatus Omnitrophota bacterium]